MACELRQLLALTLVCSHEQNEGGNLGSGFNK